MNEGAILSRPYDVVHLPSTGVVLEIEANADQQAALAETYDLVAVNRLLATTTVTPAAEGGVTVEGRVIADIVQSCVVTLEPVAQHIDEPFSVRFVPGVKHPAAKEVAIDPEAEDPPEVMDGTSLDVGALAEEMFVLAIEPYPRAPGAELPAEQHDNSESGEESPFAVLRSVLRARK